MKHKLLIVDDSLLIRKFLIDIFSKLDDFEIIGEAADPYEARDIMRKNWPDVITLDIEMPKMNGIDFLKKIMKSKPTPVVMLSTLTKAGAPITLEALEIGAVDYIQKPSITSKSNLKKVEEEIILKVRNAVKSNIRKRRVILKESKILTTTKELKYLENKLILIGSSTGGVQALTSIVKRLPKKIPPIAIVQHIPPTFVESLADQLRKKGVLEVKVAENKEKMNPGTIYIAPGMKHLEVIKKPDGYYTKTYEDKPYKFHLPAVNKLFLSGAKIGNKNILGIILTGMGEDGAEGMVEMKKKGCRTIGQDKESSIVYGMPKKAFDYGGVEIQVPLSEIPEKIVEFSEGKL